MISFSSVVKRYPGGQEALKGVSFAIEAGEFAFIAGHCHQPGIDFVRRHEHPGCRFVQFALGERKGRSGTQELGTVRSFLAICTSLERFKVHARETGDQTTVGKCH